MALVNVKLKSSAATSSLLLLAPAAVFQDPRSIAQIEWPLAYVSQVLQAAPVEERTPAPETASAASRPLPAPKT